MAEPLLALSDYQTVMLVISLLCGALGSLAGAFALIVSQYDAPLKGRRLSVGLLCGLFAGGVVFAMLGSETIPPLKEVLTAVAFFALLLGLWGGNLASRSVDRQLQKQALLRKMVDAQL